MPRFVKARQCAAIYKNKWRAGQRCGWPAVKDSIYCAKHNGATGRKRSPEHMAAIVEGTKKYWARIRELAEHDPEAAKQFTRRSGAPKGSEEAKKRMAHARAVRDGKKAPKEKIEDKVVLKAERALVRVENTLPAVPDKPFEEMEPHEQMVVNLGLSLNRLHEILQMPVKVPGSDLVDTKLLSIVKDTALRTLAASIKIDQNKLQAQRGNKMLDILEKLRAEKEAEKSPTIEGQAKTL